MKVFKVEVENYRLLKAFSMDLEDNLSLVIGKNNTGKTSILTVLNKFLNPSEKNKFLYDDFNNDFKEELKNALTQNLPFIDKPSEHKGIKLKLYIKYDEKDNLSNVNKVMMDLDPENNVIVLGFEYIINHNDFEKLKSEYEQFKQKELLKKAEVQKTIVDFIKHNYFLYFKFLKKSFEYNKDTEIANVNKYIDLVKEEISTDNIICFKYINAKRDVRNDEIDRTLSIQTSRIYNRTESDEQRKKEIEEFKDKLSETDLALNQTYKVLFKDVLKKVRTFGGLNVDDSEIDILSTLQDRELLNGNTTVVYRHDDENKLPENFNGLGYMNLISMIFEIEIIIQEFKKKQDELPSDINLLFIEEPEAHTHPQMQYFFIKNIKSLLEEGFSRAEGKELRQYFIQYMITTHSACIVADCDFDCIKYLKKDVKNSVIAKNLKELEKAYKDEGQENNFRFLKQYLTLNRAELFFADKAIFIEGDTERILLPAMMKKIDEEFQDRPLLSQNISIIEVGNYAHIFEHFINFISIKSLIITDIDSVKKKKNDISNKSVYTACPVSEGETTSNPTLKSFFKDIDFPSLKGLKFDKKRFKKMDVWTIDQGGILQIVFQTEENSYHARSFEDAFFNINENIEFVCNNIKNFKGLKKKSFIQNNRDKPYEIAESCINSKGTLALDILINSTSDSFNNWKIPTYIKEGLLWLKKD